MSKQEPTTTTIITTHHEGVNHDHDHVPEKPASSAIIPPHQPNEKSGTKLDRVQRESKLQGRNSKAMIDKYK